MTAYCSPKVCLLPGHVRVVGATMISLQCNMLVQQVNNGIAGCKSYLDGVVCARGGKTLLGLAWALG